MGGRREGGSVRVMAKQYNSAEPRCRLSGKFASTPELQKLQRDSNDANLGVIRAAVSRSYTVVPCLTSSDTPGCVHGVCTCSHLINLDV